MLAKLELNLKAQEAISHQMASAFHGALMELIPEEYADFLHVSQLHPYRQYLERRGEQWVWIVTCIGKEAVQKIIKDVLMQLDKLYIKRQNIEITITDRIYTEVKLEHLTQRFYEEDSSRFVEIQFITPTSFKQQGRYMIYPDLRCIYQSLMNKYDLAVNEESMLDEDALDELTEKSQVIRYDLRSTNFHLEGVKIPSFIGKMTLKINGTQTMVNFANLLLEFGLYSGVGIKTALGMGAYRIIKERTKTYEGKAN